MQLPKIELASLPDLEILTGIFGTLASHRPGFDDTIVIMATVVYEASTGGGLV